MVKVHKWDNIKHKNNRYIPSTVKFKLTPEEVDLFYRLRDEIYALADGLEDDNVELQLSHTEVASAVLRLSEDIDMTYAEISKK